MVIGEIDVDTIYSKILKQLQLKNVLKKEMSSKKDKITFQWSYKFSKNVAII